jgi:hypothetical protein
MCWGRALVLCEGSLFEGCERLVGMSFWLLSFAITYKKRKSESENNLNNE